MTLEASLAGSTESATRLAGLAHELGRLAPGCHADLVVWNLDLLRIAPERLTEARPVATVLAGEVVYRPEGAESGARAGDLGPAHGGAAGRT
jgi:predicted amidohydrolase YtcJ